MNQLITIKGLRSIAIIEDDTTILNGLRELISSNIELDELFVFSNGEEAVIALTKNPVDIVMCDIQLPGIDGIECIRRLKLIHCLIQFMVLTVYDNNENIFNAITAGATSYIVKSTSPEKIIEAIEDLQTGGAPVSSTIARKMLELFRQKTNQSNEYYLSLSQREQEMLDQLSQGYRYKEIAANMFISIETVRTHIRNTYEKLHVNSRLEALKKTGLI